MILTIGKRHAVNVADVVEASAVYCRLRDESGEGGSTFPEGKLPGHRISYNGKVWKAGPWKSGDVPVYNPYAAN